MQLFLNGSEAIDYNGKYGNTTDETMWKFENSLIWCFMSMIISWGDAGSQILNHTVPGQISEAVYQY